LISLKGASLDLEGLAKILSAEGLSVETRMGEEGDPLGFVLRIYDRDRNQVDLIGGIRRLEPDFFKRALVDEFDGLKLRIASPEDLIALKLFAGGPQDIEDARGVLTIQSAGIDKDLVLSLCRRFGADVEIRSRKLLGM
jgi:predicted nucleotidyltransferase